MTHFSQICSLRCSLHLRPPNLLRANQSVGRLAASPNSWRSFRGGCRRQVFSRHCCVLLATVVVLAPPARAISDVIAAAGSRSIGFACGTQFSLKLHRPGRTIDRAVGTMPALVLSRPWREAPVSRGRGSPGPLVLATSAYRRRRRGRDRKDRHCVKLTHGRYRVQVSSGEGSKMASSLPFDVGHGKPETPVRWSSP